MTCYQASPAAHASTPCAWVPLVLLLAALLACGGRADGRLYSVAGIESQRRLSAIASGQEPASDEARLGAIAKLTDPAVLTSLLAADELAAEAAATRLLELAREHGGQSAVDATVHKILWMPCAAGAKAAAVREVSDPKTLESIIAGPVQELSLAAVEVLSDEATLLRVAQSSPNPAVRLRAGRRLVKVATHPEPLVALIRSHAQLEVRLSAIRRGLLPDPELDQIARSAPERALREAALSQIKTETAALALCQAPEVAASLCAKYLVQRVESQPALVQLAQSGRSPRVRRNAVRRVQDQAILLAVAQNDPDPAVRVAAALKIADPSAISTLLSAEANPLVRRKMFAQLDDPRLLLEIARSATSLEVRLEAIPRLADQDALRVIAREDADPKARGAAVRALTGPVTIVGRVLRRDPSPGPNGPQGSVKLFQTVRHEQGELAQVALESGVARAPSASLDAEGYFSFEVDRDVLMRGTGLLVTVDCPFDQPGVDCDLLADGAEVVLTPGTEFLVLHGGVSLSSATGTVFVQPGGLGRITRTNGKPAVMRIPRPFPALIDLGALHAP